MIKAIMGLFELLSSFLGFILNIITTFINFIVNIPLYTSLIITSFALLPPLFLPFAVASISISVLFLVIGRK